MANRFVLLLLLSFALAANTRAQSPGPPVLRNVFTTNQPQDVHLAVPVILEAGSGIEFTNTGQRYRVLVDTTVARTNRPQTFYGNLVVRTNITATGSARAEVILFGTNTIRIHGASAPSTTAHAANSVIVGNVSAGPADGDAVMSVFIGDYAARLGTNHGYAVVIGSSAGYGADELRDSIVIGHRAGQYAGSFRSSTAIGTFAAEYLTNGSSAVIMGHEAGRRADLSVGPTFIGNGAGLAANNSENSTFIGRRAGIHASRATNVVAVGLDAGRSATNAVDSIFIGRDAGRNMAGATRNVVLGPVTALASNRADALAIHSTSTTIPLIYGEFDTRLLRIHGWLDVTNKVVSPFFQGNAAGLTNLPVTGIAANGTPSSSTYLRGDGVWATNAAEDVFIVVPRATGNAAVDWANLQAALDQTTNSPSYYGARAIVIIPPGSYVINQRLLLRAHGITVMGSGVERTRIIQQSSTEPVFDIHGLPNWTWGGSNQLWWAEIANLAVTKTIEPQTVSQSAAFDFRSGVTGSQQASRLILRRIRVSGFYYGVYIGHGVGLLAEQCEMYGNNYGFYLAHADNAELTHVYIGDAEHSQYRTNLFQASESAGVVYVPWEGIPGKSLTLRNFEGRRVNSILIMTNGLASVYNGNIEAMWSGPMFRIRLPFGVDISNVRTVRGDATNHHPIVWYSGNAQYLRIHSLNFLDDLSSAPRIAISPTDESYPYYTGLPVTVTNLANGEVYTLPRFREFRRGPYLNAGTNTPVILTGLDSTNVLVRVAPSTGLQLVGTNLITTNIPLASLAAAGTRDNTTFLRGDGTWAVPPGGGGGGTTEYVATANPDHIVVTTNGSLYTLDVGNAVARTNRAQVFYGNLEVRTNITATNVIARREVQTAGLRIDYADGWPSWLFGPYGWTNVSGDSTHYWDFSAPAELNIIPPSTFQVLGNMSIDGTLTAGQFSGNGANISGLNANNLASGTVPDARLANNVARTNRAQVFYGDLTIRTNLDVLNRVTAPTGVFSGRIIGNLAQATNLPVTGIAADGTPSSTTFLRGDGTWAVPPDTGSTEWVASADTDAIVVTTNGNVFLIGVGPDVALRDTNNVWTGALNDFAGAEIRLGRWSIRTNGSDWLYLGGGDTLSWNAATSSAWIIRPPSTGLRIDGHLHATNATITGSLTAGSLSGSGSGITSLNASQLTSGTVPEARLPSSVARTNAANVFHLPNTNISTLTVEGMFFAKTGVFSSRIIGNLAEATNLPVSGIAATGTRNSSTFLRGDGTWATPPGGGGGGLSGWTSTNIYDGLYWDGSRWVIRPRIEMSGAATEVPRTIFYIVDVTNNVAELQTPDPGNGSFNTNDVLVLVLDVQSEPGPSPIIIGPAEYSYWLPGEHAYSSPFWVVHKKPSILVATFQYGAGNLNNTWALLSYAEPDRELAPRPGMVLASMNTNAVTWFPSAIAPGTEVISMWAQAPNSGTSPATSPGASFAAHSARALTTTNIAGMQTAGNILFETNSTAVTTRLFYGGNIAPAVGSMQRVYHVLSVDTPYEMNLYAGFLSPNTAGQSDWPATNVRYVLFYTTSNGVWNITARRSSTEAITNVINHAITPGKTYRLSIVRAANGDFQCYIDNRLVSTIPREYGPEESVAAAPVIWAIKKTGTADMMQWRWYKSQVDYMPDW